MLVHNNSAASVGTAAPGKLYEVGLYKDLEKSTGRRIHHVPGRAEGAALIGTHQEAGKLLTGGRLGMATREPSIRLTMAEHDLVDAAQRLKGAAASARELLAQEIRILRQNTAAPTSALKSLIELNRQLHPWDFLSS